MSGEANTSLAREEQNLKNLKSTLASLKGLINRN